MWIYHVVDLIIDIIGSEFGVRTRGLAYPGCPVALLAAVATGGYHTHSTFSWSYNGVTMSACDTIMYSESRGDFTCHIVTKINEEKPHFFCIGCNKDEYIFHASHTTLVIHNLY